MRTTTVDCFTPKQKEFFTAYAEYRDFVEKNPMPRIGYQPLSSQAVADDAHYFKMRQLSMEAGKINLKAAVDAACCAHNIKRFDINNEAHRKLIAPAVVSHNDSQYLQHLSQQDYEAVLQKKAGIIQMQTLVDQNTSGVIDVGASVHPASRTVNSVMKNFFTGKPKKITEADVLANEKYWETDEGVAFSKECFDEAAKARVLAIKMQSIGRDMRALANNAQQVSAQTAPTTQPASAKAPIPVQDTQAAAVPTVEIPDALSETLMALIGETTSIDGFEREETVTTLYAALHSQIANKASPSDIISTKTQLDLEKAKIFNERKQFDKAIHEVGHTVNIASSLAIIFGNNRLAGQIASAGHSVLTIGNAFAGIAGVGLLAAASPLELGSTLLSGIAGLVGLFRQADSGPNLAEILMPMLHAISQQLSQLRAEMHERFNQVMETLNTMQRTLLNAFIELSREAKLTQEMVLAVIAKIDHLQERQDAGFLRMNERFDQLELQIEHAEARRTWEKIDALKPIAQAKDAANYDVNMKRLLTGYDAMGAYDPLLTGKPDRANTNDLQMPAFMLAQTLASIAQFYSPVGNPLAILYTTTLLGRFIEVHHKTARDTFEGMTKEDVALLKLIDEKHILPLRRLIIALRQVLVWDTFITHYKESAAHFERESATHLRIAMASHSATENLRLKSAFSIEQLQQRGDRDIFMRQEIPIGLSYNNFHGVYRSAVRVHRSTDIAYWNSSDTTASVRESYKQKVVTEITKAKENYNEHVFISCENPTTINLKLPAPKKLVDAISPKIYFLCAKANFRMKFSYDYDEATKTLHIIGAIYSENGISTQFFKKSFQHSLHYSGAEAVWWLWMGGVMPINNTMAFTEVGSQYAYQGQSDPVFSRIESLYHIANFSDPSDQIPLPEAIERIYTETLLQEVLKSDAYHKSLRLDAEDVATPLGSAFENLNCTYLLMRRALEFLEIVSPCDIWQSNLLHELNALLSAEKILSEARRQHINPACLFPQESMFAHFRETVRTEMQKQHNNGTLFFDDTLKAFFDVVEKCASTAQQGMSVQGLKEFDDLVINGIAMMVAEMSAGRMTAEQCMAFQATHISTLQAVRSGQMTVTPTLMASLRTPQIMAPSVVSSATLFQPAAIPPAHTGNAGALSAAPV